MTPEDVERFGRAVDEFAKLLREHGEAEISDQTPIKAAFKRMRERPEYAECSMNENLEWMYREGVRQTVRRMRRLSGREDWVVAALAAIEREGTA